jgi:hypothetical protein
MELNWEARDVRSLPTLLEQSPEQSILDSNMASGKDLIPVAIMLPLLLATVYWV